MISYFLFWILDLRMFSVAGINLQTELTCLWYKREVAGLNCSNSCGGTVRTAAAGPPALSARMPGSGPHACCLILSALPPPAWY